jgi:hypothetical protein
MNTCQKHPGEPLNTRNKCMGCAREKQREHYKNYRKTILATNKLWRENNHDRLLPLKREYVKSTGDFHRKEWLKMHPVYHCYDAMRKRCLNPKHKYYKYYGGRGITICTRWLGNGGYANFEADMGPRPTPKHTVERLNNEKGYGPKNCIWATMKAQSRHRRNSVIVTLGGRSQVASDWAKELGISPPAFHNRLRNGWTEEQLLKPRQLPYFLKNGAK